MRQPLLVSTFRKPSCPPPAAPAAGLCVHDHNRIAPLGSPINSSMRRVAIGSSAEHGSSIRSTSGSVTIARAMQAAAAGRPKAKGARVQLVLHFVPQRRPRSHFHPLRAVPADAVDLQAERDIVVNAHREGIRLLEDHPDVPPHRNRINNRFVYVPPEEGTVPPGGIRESGRSSGSGGGAPCSCRCPKAR